MCVVSKSHAEVYTPFWICALVLISLFSKTSPLDVYFKMQSIPCFVFIYILTMTIEVFLHENVCMAHCSETTQPKTTL